MKSTESKTKLITAAVETYLKKNIDLKNNNKILIAYSAGPDSTVLLDVLYRLKEIYPLEIICAYYNHCLREEDEIAEELETAEKNCALRNIELFTGRDNGSLKSEIPDLGVEGAARKYRYNFLDKIFKNYKCSYTAFGHNLDDQIETVVMRFFKGSGASGLKGIPEVNGHYIRPLISVSKKDILDYINENKMVYSFDKTNNEDVFLRNKLRNSLLKISNEYFPGFEKSIISLSEKMKMTDDFIKIEADKNIKWTDENGVYSTDTDNFLRQPQILQLESLYSIVDLLNTNDSIRIPYSFLKPVLNSAADTDLNGIPYTEEIINSAGNTAADKDDLRNENNEVKLKRKSSVFIEGYGLILFRTGRKLFFKKNRKAEQQKPFSIELEDKKRIYPICKNSYICIEEKIVTDCAEKDLFIDPSCLNGNLHIRYRKDGDRISLKGGTKKIKKLFTEMGIRRDLKDRIPLICDNTEILAVMGTAFGYNDRISDKIYVNKSSNSKVLIFRIRQV